MLKVLIEYVIYVLSGITVRTAIKTKFVHNLT